MKGYEAGRKKLSISNFVSGRVPILIISLVSFDIMIKNNETKIQTLYKDFPNFLTKSSLSVKTVDIFCLLEGGRDLFNNHKKFQTYYGSELFHYFQGQKLKNNY